MADAPEHVVAAPSLPYQPWDATEAGTEDTAPQGGDVYAGTSTWVKVKEAGAASITDGTITGGWPGNGASSDGGWQQC